MHRIFRVPIFAGARKRKSSEILEFQSFALICYLLSRCVRKMNLNSIHHVLNILANPLFFLPLITPRVQFFRLLGVAVVV